MIGRLCLIRDYVVAIILDIFHQGAIIESFLNDTVAVESDLQITLKL